jgi:hypothetical protein
MFLSLLKIYICLFYCCSHFEDLGIDRNIILEWILAKYVGRLWAAFICLRIATSGGLFEHSDEVSGSIKCGEFD